MSASEASQSSPKVSKIKSSFTTSLDLPPSCIVYIPVVDDISHDLIVVGTYYLEKDEDTSKDVNTNSGTTSDQQMGKEPNSQSRRGSILLFRIFKNDECQLVDTLPTPSAILDLALYPLKDPVCGHYTLVAATSTGDVLQIGIENHYGPKINLLETFHLFSPQTLVLSIVLDPYTESTFALTLSTGAVAYVRIIPHSNPSTEIVHPCIISHSGQEVWCALFGEFGRKLYSGGDDACLRYIDTSKRNMWPPRQSGFKSSAGITSILPLELPVSMFDFDIFLIGSYSAHSGDKNLNIFYPQNGLNAEGKLLMKGFAVEGGVWRLTLISSKAPESAAIFKEDYDFDITYHVLASCMHAGARIFKIIASFKKAFEADTDFDNKPALWSYSRSRGRFGLTSHWKIEEVAEFTEHESMCYGGRAQGLPNGKETRCGTISFYDRKLCIWRYPVEAKTFNKEKVNYKAMDDHLRKREMEFILEEQRMDDYLVQREMELSLEEQRMEELLRSVQSE